MLLWHIAATTALTRYTFRDERMDLRFLFVGAVLPDVTDMPIGLLFFDSLHSVRLVAHSLLFAGALMTWIVLATRRGRPRKRWMPIAIGVLIHLFLDAMWASPETLWWPILGTDFSATAAQTVGAHVVDTLRDPLMWAGEAIGLIYLISLGKRAGLGGAGLGGSDARKLFLESGRIDVPIGFSDQ